MPLTLLYYPLLFSLLILIVGGVHRNRLGGYSVRRCTKRISIEIQLNNLNARFGCITALTLRSQKRVWSPAVSTCMHCTSRAIKTPNHDSAGTHSLGNMLEYLKLSGVTIRACIKHMLRMGEHCFAVAMDFQVEALIFISKAG
jgi:hypothetical protein